MSTTTAPRRRRSDAPTPESSTPDVGCTACGWTPVVGRLWPTEGALACEWIEDNSILVEGDWYGQLMKLRRDQQQFLYRWYEYCPDCGQWRHNEALRGAATGDGKTQFIAA